MKNKVNVCILICLGSPLIAYLLSVFIQIIVVWIMRLTMTSGLISADFNMPLFYAFVIAINSAVIVYAIERNRE